MAPKEQTKTEPTVAPISMSWEDFANRKKKTARTSRYAAFVLALKPRQPQDASAAFPKITKSDTLRSAIYNQAKRLGRKITCVIEQDHVIVALIEAA